MRLGAFGYLTKPPNFEELAVRVERAGEKTLIERENRRLKDFFYRINGVRVAMPPLRERREDADDDTRARRKPLAARRGGEAARRLAPHSPPPDERAVALIDSRPSFVSRSESRGRRPRPARN